MSRFYTICLFALITGSVACGGGGGGRQAPGSQAVDTRSYYMGFTPFPHDFAADQASVDQIVNEVYDKLELNADLVAHHFDNGIPWHDALLDTFPYHNHIMTDWQSRRDKTPAQHRTYIAITPINIDRNGLALLRDSADDMPLNAPFSDYASNGALNAADIKTAYLNYCKRVIEFFDPDYLAIGIEVNLLRKNTDAATWARYLELNQYVYNELKAMPAYADLPIFVSVSPVEAIQDYVSPSPEFAGNPAAYAASQASAIAAALNDSDYYAISIYPYLTNYFASDLPSDMLDVVFSLSGKPIAIAETGMLAEAITAYGVTFSGSESRQNDYMDLLLNRANTYQLEFINWFVQQDYDQLCEFLDPVNGCTEFQSLWRDTGIYDGAGNARTSYASWQRWLARPVN